MKSKSSVRQAMRARRRGLSEQKQLLAADKLTIHITTLSLFKNSKRIAFYFPNDGEIDPTPLMIRAWKMKKHCYLPVLSSVPGNRLKFALIDTNTSLISNRYGIPEPDVAKSKWRLATNMDLILVPLVAFDREGNRLGMGSGYYDRTLAFLARRRHWNKPCLLGIAHDFQRVDRLNTDSWDVPMEGIVTDEAYYPV